RALQVGFGLSEISLPPVQVAEIQKGGTIRRPQFERLLKIADRFFVVSLLRSEHAEVVPRFRIIRPKFQRLLEIPPRLLRRVAPEIERSQIVKSIRILRVRSYDLLKCVLSLFQKTMLKECDAVGVRVSLKRISLESPRKGKRFTQPFVCSARYQCEICKHFSGFYNAVVNLDDFAGWIDQQMCRKRQIAMPIEQIPVDDVIVPSRLSTREQDRKWQSCRPDI